MVRPKALALTGYGINCDEETRYAFNYAGAECSIVHVNDLIASPSMLKNFQIFVFPGGFSYGDDTGSGKALANRIKNNLFDEIKEFTERDTLMLGICNGFQVMVNLGVLPNISGDWQPGAALLNNSTFRYQCRWVELAVEKGSPSVFLKGIDSLHIPVAHGEGNFYAPPNVISAIEENKLAAMRYSLPGGGLARGEFPANPNGSINDIASLCDKTGRIFGMMPHPERGMFFNQRDDWSLLREDCRRRGEEIPVESCGMMIFRNAAAFFN
ncbi:MAG: phosphoribosylformylglycinamidine synthase subunit PurQ [Spirochaetia bacterium]|jgi:phosphoribosylformylglycinamidine synthase|nr:phosphoribosylformylglycinamidine synthase subunit PurQ [Spirochaetia bacterium]